MDYISFVVMGLGVVMLWIVYDLSCHNDEIEKLRKEIDELKQQKGGPE